MTEVYEPTYIGVDIGATHTRLGVVDRHGRVLADRRTQTPVGDNGFELIRWLESAYLACRDETDSHPQAEIMGLAVPGILEPGRTAVVRSVNLPEIEGLPLRDLLVERTGLEVIIDCDTVAGAWGEFCARERKPKRMIYLTIGTGIGAAAIIENKVLRYSHHSIGHWGHVSCDTADDAPLCECGAQGCLESRVGGPALNEAAQAAGFGDGISDIELALSEENEAAIEFVTGAARYLASGLQNIIHVFAPDMIVVGGGIAGVFPSLVREATDIINSSGSSLIPPGLCIELAGLDDYSGVVGIALLAADYLEVRRSK